MPKALVDELIEPTVGPRVEIDSYHWKLGSRVKVNAEQAATEWRRIHQEYGAVKPEHIVTAAEPTDALLHDEFEWDNAEAAKAYREQQASYLLRSLVVVYKRPDQTLTQPVRAFVRIVPSADDPTLDTASEDAVQPHVYLPIRQIMDEPDLRQRIKRQAFRELSTWRQRYRDISDFAAVFEQIDKIAKQFQKTG